MTRIARSIRPSAELIAAMHVIDRQPVTPIVYREDDEPGASKVDYPAVVARYKAKVTNRATAIRAMCIECSGGMLSEVRDCQVKKCALYPYRMGTDPNNKKTLDRLAKQAAEEGGE